MVMRPSPRRPPRPGAVIHWMGSLLGVLALVVGIPLFLVVFHAVPPVAHIGRTVAHPGAIGHYLGAPLSDSVVAGTVTCVAWLTWLWLAVCVVIELVAAIRGRPSWHVPASRHIQALAATLVGASLTFLPISSDVLPMRLVTTSVAISGQARSGQKNAGTGHAVAPPISLRNRASGAKLPPVLLADDVIDSANSDALYSVRPGDTLWSIAERELHDPLLWPEIAQLNYGRIQSDGQGLTDAHWIFPGWQLMLPPSPDHGGSTDVVARIAGPGPDIPSPASEGPSSAPLLQPTSPSPKRPEEIPHDADSTGGPSLAGPHPRDAGAISDHKAGVPLPFGVVGYGLLGAGVVTLLERLRRVQRRHRPAGLRIALPEGDLVELERQLRVEADPTGTDVIDIGLRAFVSCSLATDAMPPQLCVVRLGAHVLEIELEPGSSGRHPPDPFSSNADQTRWSLSTDHSTMQALQASVGGDQIDAPYPALVTVGRDEFGLVLIDLEQAASVDLTGVNAIGILGMMAAEVATARWADQVDIILIGFDHELESLERVSHLPTISEVLPRVQRRVRERAALLASLDRRANWEIRWAEGGDAWDLCLVMCAPGAVDAERDAAAELVRLVGDGGLGLAVVLASDVEGTRRHLSAEDGRITVVAPGVRAAAYRPEQVDSSVARGIGSLVEVSGNLDGVLPNELTPVGVIEEEANDDHRSSWGADIPDTVESLAIGATSLVEAAPEIEVRVLGQVEIVGADRPFARAWATELVVFLAFHRRGASSEQWATALWPDKVMAPASLHSTASAARRSLGVSKSGEDHLPRAHGRLALASTVGSDWDQFVELAGRDDAESHRQALELVRGRPFEGMRAPDWVLLEGIAANVEAIVVDLAGRFAESCLSAGDPGSAEWAARKALRVSPYDERLYRILLRAADVAGNPAGVESVMAELVRLVAEDVEPYDAVHPETLDLYRHLSRRSTPTGRR